MDCAEELRTGGKEGESGKVSSKGGSLIVTVNRNLAEILERYPVDLASVADEITEALKSRGIVGGKRGLQRAHQIQFLSNPNEKNISILKQRRNLRGQKQREINKMTSWWAGIPGRTRSKRTILLVFSGLKSGAAAHNKLGELFLTLAYLCLGSKLFGIKSQNVLALICRSMLFRCGLAHDISIFDVVHDS